MNAARKIDDSAHIESGLAQSIAEVGLGRMRTVKATARPVKVVAADGSTRTITHGEVIKALAEREGIESTLRDDGLRVLIAERRKRGEPDTCEAEGCGAELGTSRDAQALRDRKPHPWRCRRCVRRDATLKGLARSTTEQRSERARKGRAKQILTSTPAQRSEAARRGRLGITREKRAEMSRTGQSRRTPAQRSEATRKGHISRAKKATT